MKAIVTLAANEENPRVVELAADLYNEDGQVAEDVTYDDAIKQLRLLVDAVVSATYGYHRDVE